MRNKTFEDLSSFSYKHTHTLSCSESTEKKSLDQTQSVERFLEMNSITSRQKLDIKIITRLYHTHTNLHTETILVLLTKYIYIYMNTATSLLLIFRALSRIAHRFSFEFQHYFRDYRPPSHGHESRSYSKEFPPGLHSSSSSSTTLSSPSPSTAASSSSTSHPPSSFRLQSPPSSGFRYGDGPPRSGSYR